VDFVPSEQDELFLVLETPDRYVIRLNGEFAVGESNNNTGWWTDISFRKIPVDGKVQQGENHVVLKTTVKEDTELESIYLIGSFAVRNRENRRFSLIEATRTVGIGDLVHQGYPFFSGRMRYRKKFLLVRSSPEQDVQRIVFQLERLDAVLVNITINGRNAGTLAWRPLEVDVTEYVNDGENVIELEFVSSCRNLLGPHHDSRGELLSVNPGSWSNPKDWTDAYQFVPFGMTTPLNEK
jgi:hypothetical protein